MSYGDEIMASGQARVEAARTAAPVHVVGRSGQPRWSELWRGLDWIAAPGAAAAGSVVNGPGARPYLKSLSLAAGAVFTDWRARDFPGAIVLDPAEAAFAARMTASLGSFVVIEPNIAADANPNKDWGWAPWRRLTARLGDLELVQLGPKGTLALAGTRRIETPSFRLACAVLARARAAVLPEGGLHHAAAALGVRAVVIFGGHTDPETTGYPGHVNIAAGGAACGQWRPCQHCAAAMASIAPAEVELRLRDLV